ncbi:hypothetical protein COP2_047804 [Malus domestica]
MASNSTTSALVTLFMFAMVLSPISTSEAARSTFIVSDATCPACVCCPGSAPKGSCCKCCASSTPPINSLSNKGAP